MIDHCTLRDRMTVWGRTGASWAGLSGFLLGSAFSWIPGAGPHLAAGPWVRLVAALGGAIAFVGLSAADAALFGLGPTTNRVPWYEPAPTPGEPALVAGDSMGKVLHADQFFACANLSTSERHGRTRPAQDAHR